MTLTPTLTQFISLAKSHNLIPVWGETVVDRLTPVAMFERLGHLEPYSFLLESVEGGERLGRYSFIGRRPHAVFQVKDDRVTYTPRQGKPRVSASSNPLQTLKERFAGYRIAPVEGLPRFWGGAVGYWDYETVHYFERIPRQKPDRLALPGAIFQLTGELVILDRFLQTAQVLCCVHIPDGASRTAMERLYRVAVKSIQSQIRALHAPAPAASARHASGPVRLRPLTDPSDYERAVQAAKAYIQAGDIIQTVLSRRWSLKTSLPPFQVYRALRRVNPSPYMYYLHTPECDIVGTSPELLVRKEGTLAETRPIAGTRRRGTTPEEDRALADELRLDPKERAEHLMLVDLGRNDLGRVCQPGSVTVPELMTIENYSHVMHLVSSVTGRLSDHANAFDLFQACFPAGTVSGAPKIRAMEIIDELEPFQRGPYAGALGYFSYSGNMDMAITIRTLLFKGGTAYLQAGAGIVADSDPRRESQECEHKAAALVAALQRAGELS